MCTIQQCFFQYNYKKSDYKDTDGHVSTQDTSNTSNNPLKRSGQLKNDAHYENTDSH